MKYCIVALLSASALGAQAQGLYFDIGAGAGAARTLIGSENVRASFGSAVSDTGVELGIRLGFGPLESLPVYLAAELSGIGHRFQDTSNYLQFNSYMAGPSLFFYPADVLQIGGALGVSWVSNSTDFPATMYRSVGGFAGNIYAALDLGNDDHALLVGFRYSWANNTLEVSGARQENTLFSFFLKYAFRQRGEKAEGADTGEE